MQLRAIPGLPGFSASADGQIYRVSSGEAQIVPPQTHRGYLRLDLRVAGCRVTPRVHRLVWEAWRGPIPDGKQIDHIDGDRANNALANLRLATNGENSRNRTRLGSNNTSGATGVWWDRDKRRWVVDLYLDGKRLRVGRFRTLEGAKIARRAAEAEHYGEFAPRRSS